MNVKSTRKNHDFYISGAFVFVMLLLCVYFSKIVFLTNDDFLLQLIVSGSITGTPDAHMVYSHVLWGCILSGLYKITKVIDWYTVLQLLSLWIGYSVILWRIIKRVSQMWQKLLISLFYTLAVAIFLYRSIVMLQFTITAAVVGASAVLYALTLDMEEDKGQWIKDGIQIAFLVILSNIIREMSLYMMIPFAAVGWLGKWISSQDKSKTAIKRFIAVLVEIACVVALLKVWDFAYYRFDPNWNEYKKYNAAREAVIDYNGFPEYAANEQFYQSIGMSNQDYEALANHYTMILQQSVSTDSLQKIASYTSNDRLTVKETVSRFIDRNIDYTDRPFNLLVYILWGISLLSAFAELIYQKKGQTIIRVALLLLCRMPIWLYLIHSKRFPDRVSQGLYIIEGCFLIWIILDSVIELPKKKMLVVLMLALVMVMGVKSGIPKLESVREDCFARDYYSSAYYQVKEYTANNPGNLYFMDMNSMAIHPRQITGLSEANYSSNLIFLGGWISGSPFVDQKAKEYGIENLTDLSQVIDCEKAFYICKDAELTNPGYLVDLLSQAKTVNCRDVDRIKTDCGIDYIVYKISEEE